MHFTGLDLLLQNFSFLLAEFLCGISYIPSKEYPDVYMRPDVKSNGSKYWEYVLFYVDNVRVLSFFSVCGFTDSFTPESVDFRFFQLSDELAPAEFENSQKQHNTIMHSARRAVESSHCVRETDGWAEGWDIWLSQQPRTCRNFLWGNFIVTYGLARDATTLVPQNHSVKQHVDIKQGILFSVPCLHRNTCLYSLVVL